MDKEHSKKIKEGMEGMVKRSSKKVREVLDAIDEEDLHVLNEREMEAILLRSGRATGEIMRYREIGDVLDIRPQEARVYVQSALKKLKKILKSKEVYW